MADSRINKANADEDVACLECKIQSLEQKNDLLENLRRSVEVLEIRSHEM